MIRKFLYRITDGLGMMGPLKARFWQAMTVLTLSSLVVVPLIGIYMIVRFLVSKY